MNKAKNDRFQAVIWTILLLAAAATPSAVRADEPPPACPKCSTAERGIPILDKIPFVSRLFKNVGSAQERTASPLDVERVGIDFEFEVCPDCPLPPGISAAACTQLFAVRRAAHQAAAPCCEKACRENGPCCGEDCAEASACCRASCETAEHRGLSWERIIELSASNATLAASLEAQAAFHKEKSEMMEALAEMAIEKAKLEMKVESLAQQSQITKEMLSLIGENARLNVQVQIAETKLNIVHEMAKLAMENEQLKLALQKRHSPGQLADDVQYLPPSPEVKANRPAPAKKASFHEAVPAERHYDAVER